MKFGRKKLLVLVSFCFVSLIFFYTTLQGYSLANKVNSRLITWQPFSEGKYGVELINLLDLIVYEIDLRRIFGKFSLNPNQVIDIKLSQENLSEIEERKNKFKTLSYIDDSSNPWMKGQILIDESLVNMKFRFHGTSATVIHRGGVSFRVKIRKEGPYYLNEVRDFRLISSIAGPSLPTIVLNHLASNFGLISQPRKYVKLRMNGSDVGLFQYEKSLSPEFFERDLQMTNVTVIKSIDDWNRKELKDSISHQSASDLWVENKEFQTTSNNPEVALGALEVLLNSIKKKDVITIKKLIDFDYFAKFAAFSSITNSNHFITGDNLKYIFDHTKGKFYLLYRIEDTAFPVEPSLTKFSFSWLNTPEVYADADTHELFKILLVNKEFNSLKNKYLYELVNSKDEIFSEASKVYSNNFPPLIFNRNFIPRHKINYEKEIFFNVLENNFEVARDYLTYEKVFISAIKRKDFTELSFINDSYHDLIIKDITLQESTNTQAIEKDNNKDLTVLKFGSILPQPSIKDDFSQKVDKQIFRINSTKTIDKISLINLSTGLKVEDRDIYLIYKDLVEFSTYEESIRSLEKNKLVFEIFERTIKIKSGLYEIMSDLIIPYDFNLLIEPGTEIFIKEGVSIYLEGDLYAIGTQNQPIKIRNYPNEGPFGVFAVVGKEKRSIVKLENFFLEGGSSSIIEGVEFLGQISLHNVDLEADRIFLSNSFSDDGINVRNSKVEIRNSEFKNNSYDQIDLDFCRGNLHSNIFTSSDNLKDELNGDGVDLSGSIVTLTGNHFTKFSDKAVSVGEESIVFLNENNFNFNAIAIAVKDGSKAFISNKNTFNQNIKKYSIFVKKPFFSEPEVFLTSQGYKEEEIDLVKGYIKFVSQSEIKQHFSSYEY